jgi:hypothetical protein
MNSIFSELALLALAGCASAPVSVVDLSAQPKPTAPPEAMRPIPAPDYLLKKLDEIFTR